VSYSSTGSLNNSYAYRQV